MNINWFTVIAQAINFLILVWLLKRFLYKPILNAIDEREKKIATQIKDASDKKVAAEKEQTEFKKRNDDFDEQKTAVMNKVISDAKAQRVKLMEEATNDANSLRANLEKAIKEKQESDMLANDSKTQDQVFTIARKALEQIASTSLEEQTVNVFIKRLHELTDGEKEKLVTAFKSNTHTILVRSSFDLPTPQQAALKDAVNEVLESNATFQFTKSSDLIVGIELTTNGYKLAWSFLEYLKALKKNISDEAKD